MKKFLTITLLAFCFSYVFAQPAQVTKIPGGTDFTNVNGTLFYFYGDSLVKSNGTARGTVLVRTIPENRVHYSGQGGKFQPFPTFNGNLFFVIKGASDMQLWVSNGTRGGTRRLKSFNSLYGFKVFKNALYFIGDDGISGRELWRVDPSLRVTLFKDINPGSASAFQEIYIGTYQNKTTATVRDELIVASTTLYFVADNGKDGRMIWKSDGTPQGTVITGISGNGIGSAENTDVIGNDLYYITRSALLDTAYLWKTNGTPAGTTLLSTFNSPQYEYDILNMVSTGSKIKILLFSYWDHYEMWETDGTAGGTVSLGDYEYYFSFSNFEVLGDRFFYANFDENQPQYVYLRYGPGSYDAVFWDNKIEKVGEHIFTGSIPNPVPPFTIDDYSIAQDYQLRQDGILLKDIFPASAESFINPDNLTNVNGVLYYTTYNWNTKETILYKYAPKNIIQDNSLAITSLSLIDTRTQSEIKTLNNMDSVGSPANATSDLKLNIRANTSGNVSRVVFEFDNNRIFSASAPFTLGGTQNGVYLPYNLFLGTHLLRVIPYSATGSVGVITELWIEVVGADRITSFTLVNADSDKDLRMLADGDTLDLAALPTDHLNIRANTNVPRFSSVDFQYYENNNYDNFIRTDTPYAVFGQTHGDYSAWTPVPGSYMIYAMPTYQATFVYTSNYVPSSTIHFYVKGSSTARLSASSASDPAQASDIKVFPNPADSKITLVLPAQTASYAIVNAYGVKFTESSVTNSAEAHIDLESINLLPGLYFIEVKDDKGQMKTVKFIKK